MYYTRIIFVTAVALVLILPNTSFAATTPLTRTLRFGSVGDDVKALQILLNSSPETRIADSGPGSPGFESTYFGLLTQKAVIKFQEKYRPLILTPNGLSAGTGFVGQSTISVLTAYAKNVATTENSAGQQDIPTTAAPSLSANTNPNIVRLAGTLATIDASGKKQGLSAEQITLLKETVTKDVLATTTDLQAAFLKQVMKDNPSQKLTFLGRLRALVRDFKDLMSPNTAFAADYPCSSGLVDNRDACTYQLSLCALLPASSRAPGGSCAQFADFLGSHEFPGTSPAQANPAATAAAVAAASAAGAVPFGGMLAGTPIFCVCTASWWVPITPLPPTFPVALNYMPGTQGFMSYNIPFALWMLGFYVPGPQCLIYVGHSCVPLPVQGQILPVVGSSL